MKETSSGITDIWRIIKMSFYKKDLKYYWLSEIMEKRLENTCMYFSTEYGKRCKFVGIGFSSGLCVPVKDAENWGCVYYKKSGEFLK